jgi:hypothetical protein
VVSNLNDGLLLVANRTVSHLRMAFQCKTTLCYITSVCSIDFDCGENNAVSAIASEGSHFMNDTNIITRVRTNIQYAITVMHGAWARCSHQYCRMFTGNTMQWRMHNRSKMANGWNHFCRSTEHINLGARLMYTLSRGHDRITNTRDWGEYDINMTWLTAALPTPEIWSEL